MTDSLPRKNRVPHWGWLLAATMLIVTTFVGFEFVALPLHRTRQFLAKSAARGIRVQIDWFPLSVGDRMGIPFGGFDAVTAIDASASDFSDQDLKSVAGFSRILYLNLEGTRVTPAGVAQFKAERPGCQIEGP